MYYHLHCNMISKSKHQSCKELSNYQSAYGKKWEDKQQEVVSDNMLFADRVPADFRERLAFWDAVEQYETGQMARAFDVAIPNEFNAQQADETARAMAQQFINDGLPAVQYSVHFHENNHHIHFLIPTRNIDENGKWENKQKKVYIKDEHDRRVPVLDENRVQEYFEQTGVLVNTDLLAQTKDQGLWQEMVDATQKLGARNRKQWKRETVEEKGWDNKEYLLKWRKDWEACLNNKMQEIGLNDRVDCRSYEAQGIDKVPTVHLGKTAHIETRTERKQENENREQFNAEKNKAHNLAEMYGNEYIKLRQQWRMWMQELIAELREIVRLANERTHHKSRGRGR